MKRQFILGVFVSVLMICALGCGSNSGKKASFGEGTIVYKVSYPDSLEYGFKAAFFPKEIVLVFKGEKAVFIASGGMGMIQLVNLLDHEKKSYVSLLIDRLRQNYGCKLSADEIKANETSSPLEIKLIDGSKVVAGVECKKAIAKDLLKGTSTEIYYDEGVRFFYGNSPFKELNYLFLEYTHTGNKLTMKLEASSVDLSTPVDTGLFSIKGDYVWVSQQQLFDHLNSL